MSKETSREWRQRLRKAHLCEKCKSPSKHKARCDKCVLKAAPDTKRQLTDDQWLAQDWSKNNAQLSQLLNVKEGTVSKHRRRLGKKAFPAGRPRKSCPVEHAAVVEAITAAALRGVSQTEQHS